MKNPLQQQGASAEKPLQSLGALELNRLIPFESELALLPCGANKAPLVSGWPQHPGWTVADLLQHKAMQAVGARTGLATGPLICFDFDGLSAVDFGAQHGLCPWDAKAWQVHRDNDAARLKVLFRPTPDQISQLPHGEFSGKTHTGEGEALEVFFHGGRQVVLIGTHPSGGQYIWPDGLGPEQLCIPPDSWWQHALQVAGLQRKAVRPRSVRGGARAKTRLLDPCPICGRHSGGKSNLWCSQTADGLIFCMPGSSFNADSDGSMPLGTVVNGYALVARTPFEKGDCLTFRQHRPDPLQAIRQQLVEETEKWDV